MDSALVLGKHPEKIEKDLIERPKVQAKALRANRHQNTHWGVTKKWERTDKKGSASLKGMHAIPVLVERLLRREKEGYSKVERLSRRNSTLTLGEELGTT